MKKMFVLISLISIILIASLIGLKDSENNQLSKGKAVLVINVLGNSKEEIIDLNQETVIEILRKNHDIKGKTRLECIDAICNQNEFWWHFYVNDKVILSAVDKYMPKKGDTIKLEYGE